MLGIQLKSSKQNLKITSKIIPEPSQNGVRKLSKNNFEKHIENNTKQIGANLKNGAPGRGEKVLFGCFFVTGAPLEPQGPPRRSQGDSHYNFFMILIQFGAPLWGMF